MGTINLTSISGGRNQLLQSSFKNQLIAKEPYNAVEWNAISNSIKILCVFYFMNEYIYYDLV